jgi:hypothetical protein
MTVGTMVANPIHSIDRSKEKDGCLLLSLQRNVLFSLNEGALVIWSMIEKNPQGISTEQLVDCLERCYTDCDVSRFRIGRDVEELLAALSNRGFLTISRNKGSEREYRIKEDVFRTGTSERDYEVIDKHSAAELAYCPYETAESSRLRALMDTCVGLLAIVIYEFLLRAAGFGRLCEIVERWPVKTKRLWAPLRVRQVCAAIDRARLWYPKQVLCLQHSAVVTCLLRQQGVPARMVFGARRKPFYAHAWSEVYGAVVNDDQSVRDRYQRFIRCLGSSFLRTEG